MQMATNDFMSFHLLIYVLTIECLRGFNIKSKGFVNVHEMYIPIVTCTVYLYVGNSIARVNHCESATLFMVGVYSDLNCLPFRSML